MSYSRVFKYIALYLRTNKLLLQSPGPAPVCLSRPRVLSELQTAECDRRGFAALMPDGGASVRALTFRALSLCNTGYIGLDCDTGNISFDCDTGYISLNCDTGHVSLSAALMPDGGASVRTLTCNTSQPLASASNSNCADLFIHIHEF